MIRMLILSVLLVSQAVADEPTIHPKDTILLQVSGIPADEQEFISRYYRVDDSGSINLPYLGKVAVGGLTVAEAARLIDKDYAFTGMAAHPSATVSIGGPDPSTVEVRVDGPVQHPGRYRVKNSVTIEQAFAQAGGWSGSGEDGIPAKVCALTHDVDGKIVYDRIHIHIDRKTRQIQILDETWKNYYLAEGDRISLAEVLN